MFTPASDHRAQRGFLSDGRHREPLIACRLSTPASSSLTQDLFLVASKEEGK